jgi:hypothetical protein
MSTTCVHQICEIAAMSASQPSGAMNAHTKAHVFVDGGSLFRTFLFIPIAVLGCATKPVVFEGTTAISVIGEPPGQPKPVSFEVRNDAIVVERALQFDAEAAIAPGSLELLDEVVSACKQHPGTKRIIFEATPLPGPRKSVVAAYLTGGGVSRAVVIVGAAAEEADGGGDATDAAVTTE